MLLTEVLPLAEHQAADRVSMLNHDCSLERVMPFLQRLVRPIEPRVTQVRCLSPLHPQQCMSALPVPELVAPSHELSLYHRESLPGRLDSQMNAVIPDQVKAQYIIALADMRCPGCRS